MSLQIRNNPVGNFKNGRKPPFLVAKESATGNFNTEEEINQDFVQKGSINMKRILFLGMAWLLAAPLATRAADFTSQFANTFDRIWVGENYWANPMEDWRIHEGRLENITPGGDRNVHLLTHKLT